MNAAEALSAALADALERDEFSLAWQPQMDLKNGELCGVEVLLRWHHPALGKVAPAIFVPVLESSGQIVPVGRWVLTQACAQAVAWRRAGLSAARQLRVGVNVSPVQLAASDFATEVLAALSEAGLPPQALGIEITESGLLNDPGAAASTLRRLQMAGVEISLDDFGTGHSSLARLRDLPVDVVKIDRAFVDDIGASASVTRAIIHLSHGLHRLVLAEGVETEAQLQALVTQGCDRLQGHIFSPALDTEAMTALLAANPSLLKEQTLSGRRPRTLLLVDDEPHILAALKRLFRRDGYRVFTAGSGSEGLAMLREHAVDVIVSDQRMPAMSGVDFLRQAKEICPHTVRMTLSGYTDLQSIIDAVNEGAVYKFLTKPWDDERLREHVALAFRQRELDDDNQRLLRENAAANAELALANQRLERLVAQEHQRALTLQDAAGAAHDLLGGLPLAVFGFDSEARLAYVNARALADWPQWAADLGDSPAPELASLLLRPDGQTLTERKASLGGRPVRMWLARMALPGSASGQLLAVLPLDGLIA
ncbi:MAG: EAL domain-containing protein [Rubrivivax sp.]|jgi:EAL domain-containing protein (putative c-di-GMP-specific phosphodiesterase class I)/CheY-like chemotaxis protein